MKRIPIHQSCSRVALWSSLVLLFATSLAGCEKHAAEPQAEAPRPVVAMELVTSDPTQALRLTGTVEAWAEEDIAFEVAGRVRYIARPGTVLEGRWEENGEVIIEGGLLGAVDREVYEANVLAAEADLEQAQVNAERVAPEKLAAARAENRNAEDEYERLAQMRKRDRGVVSERQLAEALANRDATRAQVRQAEAELAAAQAAVESAEAALARARLDLTNTELRAPFTGEVSEVYVQAGGYVPVGQRAAHLVMMDPIRVKVNVSAETSRRIQVGDVVHLFAPGRSEPVLGRIEHKATVADPGTRTFTLTALTRNLKVLVNPPADDAVLSLPRVRQLFPVITREPNTSGPLYVEEKQALQQDDQGHFVWVAEGVTLENWLDPAEPTFRVRKVRVTVGDGRLNYQGIFLLRELADPGKLEPLQLLAVGVPEGIQDGERLALLREDWLMQPGGLVQTQFARDAGVPGFYVPMQAIMPTESEQGYIFVVDTADGSQDGAGQARQVEVTLHETVGELQRIEARDPEDLQPGAQVIIEGVHYLQPGEPVSIVKTAGL